MSNNRNRRDRRRPRSRSMSPQLFTKNWRDLRNNLRHRSRSRSPRLNKGDHCREMLYSPTSNFRDNKHEIEGDERFYIERHQQEEHYLKQEPGRRSPAVIMRHMNRRNFRSRSRDFDREPHDVNFELNSRTTRFSPPDSNLNLRNQQHFNGPQKSVIYENEIVKSTPIWSSKNQCNDANMFTNTWVVEHPKLTPSNISWQPPPNEVIIIADAASETMVQRQLEPLQQNLTVIPVFDPDNEAFNSRQFVEKLDELGKIHKWNEEEIKFNFVTHLAGSANSWHINSNRMMNPWNNVKRTFINSFPPLMNYNKMLREMLNRVMTPKENLKAYFMHKTILLNQVEIFGRRAVSCIIAGLQQRSDEVKQTASSKNLGTPEELLAYIIDLDSKAQEKVKSGKKREEQAVAQAVAATSGPPLLSDASILQAHEMVAKQRLQLNICHNSMRDDHTARDCPNLQSTKRHIISKHCIEVSINGVAFQGYNDLSSAFVTMREVEVKQSNIQFQRYNICIRGVGNALVTALGKARVIIHVDKVMLSCDIYVVPNAAQDIAVVIGRSFRNHPDVRYVEAEMGISFTQIAGSTQMTTNSSFAANGREMAYFNSSLGGGGGGGGTQKLQHDGGNSRSNNQNRQMDKRRRK